MDVVNQISLLDRDGQDMPLEPVIMEKVYIAE